MDNEVKNRAKQQKAKVLDALWKMDIESRNQITEALKKKKHENTDDEAPSWKEILDKENPKKNKKKPKLKKEHEIEDDLDSGTSTISIPDVELDLTPSKEWTLSDKIKETKAIVHKDLNSETDEKNLVKREKQKIIKKDKIKVPAQKNEQFLSPQAYDKSRIVKGSPSRKLKKPKKEKKEKKIVEKKPSEPQGKLIRKIPKPVKRYTEGLNPNDKVQGANILIQDPDQDLLSRQESTIHSEDDNTSNLGQYRYLLVLILISNGTHKGSLEISNNF